MTFTTVRLKKKLAEMKICHTYMVIKILPLGVSTTSKIFCSHPLIASLMDFSNFQFDHPVYDNFRKGVTGYVKSEVREIFETKDIFTSTIHSHYRVGDELKKSKRRSSLLYENIYS